MSKTNTTRGERRRRLMLLSAAMTFPLLLQACAGGEEPTEETDVGSEDVAPPVDEEEADTADVVEPDQEAEGAPEDGAEEASADTFPDPGEATGDSADSFPERELTVVLAVGPGGNIDTGARQLQPYLSEELGVDVIIENIEGGQQALGAQHVADAEADCYTILSHIFPNMTLGAWFQDDITYDPIQDFVPLHAVNWDPTIIRIANDAPWGSLEELIEDARSRPGEIPLGVAGYNTQYISTVNFEEAHDIEFNKVLFGSAGDQRAALRAGDVDVITTGVYTSYDLNDMSYVAALVLQEDEENQWPDFTDNARTVPEITGEAPLGMHTVVGYFAPAGCAQEYPARYERLVEALNTAVQSEGFISDLEELGEEDKILRPLLAGDDYAEYLEENNIPYLREFADFVMENDLL